MGDGEENGRRVYVGNLDYRTDDSVGSRWWSVWVYPCVCGVCASAVCPICMFCVRDRSCARAACALVHVHCKPLT